MSEFSQIVVPVSFVALFQRPGRSRPDAPAAQIAARHEFCDDLASLLVDSTRDRQWELGVPENEVLQRVHRGLLEQAGPVSPDEAGWVVRRLSELLGWPMPAGAWLDAAVGAEAVEDAVAEHANVTATDTPGQGRP